MTHIKREIPWWWIVWGVTYTTVAVPSLSMQYQTARAKSCHTPSVHIPERTQCAPLSFMIRKKYLGDDQEKEPQRCP